jgi:hypothetical protein
MARPARPWFRFYVEALSDRKLRRLTPAQRWLWVAVLGAARQSPVPGALMVSENDAMDERDIADVAGMTLREVDAAMPLFERAGMVHRDGLAWVVTNWSERQYESDNTTLRTQKHRSKERSNVVPGNAPDTDTDTETDTETENEPPVVPRPPSSTLDAQFEEFWSAYPRRVGKQAARKAWDRARKQTTVEVVLAAAAAYRDDPHRKPEFTAHPTTWLNRGGWDDERLPAPDAITVTRVDPLERPRLPDYVPAEVPDATVTVPEWFKRRAQ